MGRRRRRNSVCSSYTGRLEPAARGGSLVSMRMPFLLLAIALAAAGCGKWSSEERRQVDAFTTSVVKADEASTLSPLEVEKVTATLKEALDASSIVTDPVLAKIHPELPEQYR